MRHTTLATFAHQEYPFALLVKQLQPERDPSRSPLFQVMFTLNKAQLSGEEAMGAFSLGEEGARMNLGGLPLESMRLEQRIAQFDLSLTMVEAGNELSASLEYNTDLFDTATIKRMLGHFHTLLAAVAARPSQRLDRLPLLNDSERHLLLDEWSGAVVDHAAAKVVAPFVHQLFEQHVEQHPENTAVVFEGARLNYGELNARANRLAHYLRRRGVRMDVPVAICVERSLEMVVAVMGVLKSGGAYVPLDPRYRGSASPSCSQRRVRRGCSHRDIWSKDYRRAALDRSILMRIGMRSRSRAKTIQKSHSSQRASLI